MKIDDLNDEMLQEIFCRLPCYRTARRCKSVSKRWNSVISDPFFITQGFLTHRGIKEEEPFSVFLLKMWRTRLELVTAMIAPPCLQPMADLRGARRPKISKFLVKFFQLFSCSSYIITSSSLHFQRTLSSPFLSLESLPHASSPRATFKDLILSYKAHNSTGLHLFYICNPFTKQWTVLPACQVPEKDDVIWAAFTYQDGRGFRVVVAHSKPKTPSSTDPFVMINLLIFISETFEWRNIHVRLQFKPTQLELYLYNDNRASFNSFFQGVVCEGLVCIHYAGHFGAFNPFHVTDTCHGTLTAIDLPSPSRNVCKLFKSDGNLVAYDMYVTLWFRNLGYFSAGNRIWKLDMRTKQLPPEWELLLDNGDRIDIKRSMQLEDLESRGYRCYNFAIVGVHPRKEHLVYMATLERRRSSHQTCLVLLDTKSKTVEQLSKTIPPHDLELLHASQKLDIPSWPTPIPLP